jgi:hypothetical protein
MGGKACIRLVGELSRRAKAYQPRSLNEMSKKFSVAAGAAMIAASLAFAAPASADGVKIGTLACHVASGWGFVFGSSKDMRCNFASANGMGEHYVGTISKFGVDIGYTSSAVIIWEVFAPTAGAKRGALQGGYAGATASATAGVGAGVNVLVGGLDRSITLQPVSIEGSTGLNVAAGIGAMSLKYAP